jgi:hypothetical protein
MTFWRYCWLVAAIAALMLQGGVFSQEQNQNPLAPPIIRPSSFTAFISIPVPYDPSELVTGGARFVQDPQERAAALQMLVTGHRLSNVRLQPYDLKTSFASYGSLPSDGRWALEDIAPGAGIYRWSAEGPSFSGIFLSQDRLLSSNQPGGGVPLRLAQVRSAIFGVYFPEIGPRASLRVADGILNGLELHCVLVGRGGVNGNRPPPFAAGRSFGETEYCVDPKTGLLGLYSPYPGLYIRYDYADAIHFHDTIIPSRFTISENGKTIIEAKTESAEDPPAKTSSLFDARGLSPIGGGMVMEVPTVIEKMGFAMGSSVEITKAEIVVLHGVVTPSGKLEEVEVLLSTNPGLNDFALDRAEKSPIVQMNATGQPGAANHPREIVFTQEFAPPPPPPPCPPNFNPPVMMDGRLPCQPSN